MLLSIVSGVVLLIVCLNIANLLLARASARRAELGVRIALGAPRWRIARQSFAEATILGLVGTIGGVLCAAWASRALVARLPFAQGPIGQLDIDVGIDWRVFTFTAAIAAVAIVLFGILPALYATRVAPIEALRDAGRESGARRAGVMSSALVVVQIALSIVLVSAASLFARTAARLADVPLGFDPAGLAVLTVTLPRTVKDADEIAALRDRLLERVAAVPGAGTVVASVWNPVGTGGGGLLADASGRRANPNLQRPLAFNFVTPGWLGLYRTSLQGGRDFAMADGASAPRVAIVNEALVRSGIAGTATIGSTINAGPCGKAGCTLVGVVANAVYGQSLRDEPPPIVYMPLAQSRGLAPENGIVRISIRPAAGPAALLPSLAAAAHEISPGATFSYRRVEEDVDEALARERLVAILALFFGGIGLLLCGVGLYGITQHAVTRRRGEIGIRLALGGQPRAVVRGVLRQVVLLVAIGIAGGLLAAFWLSRFAAPLLFGLAPHDPITLTAAPPILALTAMVAAWIPASRAARIDPANVLRQR